LRLGVNRRRSLTLISNLILIDAAANLAQINEFFFLSDGWSICVTSYIYWNSIQEPTSWNQVIPMGSK